MINTTAIKNLSIAYEALAHASGVEDLQQRIYRLLDKEIHRAEKRQLEQDDPFKTVNTDDIPF